ncbi:MAG TPA: MFS transporter [Gaiellaceae bacterium]|nr:MFS transporter [Gaiellaceae bacterium]
MFVEAILFTALAPLLPDLVERFDLSKTGAGALSAAYPLGALAASFPSIVLARRVGLRRTVVVSLLVLAGASVLLGLATSAALVFSGRFFQGVGSAFAYTGALSWLTATVSATRRAEAIGVAFSAAFVGALLGPLLGAVADATGLAPVFLATAGFAAALAALTLMLPAPKPLAADPPPLRRLSADGTVVVSVWLIGLAGALLGVFGVLIPLHLDEVGWSAIAIGVLFAFASVLVALASPFVGRLADRAGRGTPLRIGLLLAAGTSLGLALEAGAWVYAALSVLAAVAAGILWGPAMALLADAVERRGYDYAAGFGLMNAAWSPGFAVGAGAGAALAALLGDAATYLAVAATCVVSAVVATRQEYERPFAPEPVP